MGSVVFSGKWQCIWHKPFVFLCKGPAWYHCLWFGGRALPLSHCPHSNCFWTRWRALGNMGFHLNNSMRDQGLVWVIGGDRLCSQSIFCLWVWPVAGSKDPWSALQPLGYWKIVQYSFCKSPLEIVMVLSICIFVVFAICILYFCFVVLHYRPLIVSSFAGTKFDILWHTMLRPICGVLYIFYYINLVLPTFCCRVAVPFVNNNMYTHLVWLCCSVI